MMMTLALIVERCGKLFVHMSTCFEWCTQGVGHAMNGAAAFDFPGSAEGGDATRFVRFRYT